MRGTLPVFMFLSLAAAASAQAPPPNALRLMGTVTSVSPTSVTVQQTDGTSTVMDLAPTVTVTNARPIDVETIKPGTFVATANTNLDGGSGKSIELRIYDTSSKPNTYSAPMSRANTTMTNGTVQTVKKGDGGREFDVSYPGGVRHIVVPPDVKVIGNFPGTSQDIVVGATVSVIAAKGPSGTPVATRITVNGS